jgi:ceramide glucosyltransferase
MSAEILDLVAVALLVLAAVGSLYSLVAVALLRRFAAQRPPAAARFPGITVLKPLYGAEAGLYENLASFCQQEYPGPVQIIFGLREADDPAAATFQQLKAAFPEADLQLVLDPSSHGANGKISNLVNMSRAIRHEVVVLADSDIRVDSKYLRQLIGALDQPGVGLVTCLYRGLPAGGIWSRLAAMVTNHHFFPSVLVGLALGRSDPCFGATIALRRRTLAEIGGFEAFVDHLADDHALGVAVHRLGQRLVVPSMLVSHICRERSALEMLRQELRWARTLRLLDPLGFLGSVVTHPVPLALLGAALAPGHVWGWAILGLALASRLLLELQADKVLGTDWPAWRLGPLRDLLSFAVFVASHFTGAVTWRGQRFRVRRDGTLIPAKTPAR